jgi:site-specific DNA recombinase
MTSSCSRSVAVAEYERTLIAERMRRGRLAKLQAGLMLPWTHPPYAYRLHPDHPRDPAGVTLDPGEAAVVRELFAWYLEPGGSLYELVRRLRAAQIPSPHGQAIWGLATIRGILTNPATLGRCILIVSRTAHPRSDAQRPIRLDGRTIRQ